MNSRVDASRSMKTTTARSRPPRLAEAPHERRVAGLEKDEHRVEPPHLPELPEDFRKRREKPAFADVDDDGDLVDVAAGAQRQLGERRDQRGGQIVDAE